MSYHPLHEARALMGRLGPAYEATARRWRPVLEEYMAPGLAPLPFNPVAIQCSWCWGQGRLWERTPKIGGSQMSPRESQGFLPPAATPFAELSCVPCSHCRGTGWEPW